MLQFDSAARLTVVVQGIVVFSRKKWVGISPIRGRMRHFDGVVAVLRQTNSEVANVARRRHHERCLFTFKSFFRIIHNNYFEIWQEKRAKAK